MTNCKIWAFALYLQSLSREERLWCHICDMYYNFLCILIRRTPNLVAMYRRQGLLKTYLNLDPQRTKIWPWFVFHKCLHKHKNISKHVIITCMYYVHNMMFPQGIHISIGQWSRIIFFECDLPSFCVWIYSMKCF